MMNMMYGFGVSGAFGGFLRLVALVAFFYSIGLALRETHKPKKDRDFASAVILAAGSIGLVILTSGGVGY